MREARDIIVAGDIVVGDHVLSQLLCDHFLLLQELIPATLSCKVKVEVRSG
jgi:hypothetical protein